MKNKNLNKLSIFSKLFIIFYVVLFLLLYLLPIANYLKSFSTNNISTEYFLNYMNRIGCKSSNQINSVKKIEYIYKSDTITCPYDITYIIVSDSEYIEKIYNEYWNMVSMNTEFLGFDRKYTISKGNDYRIVIRNDNSVFYLQTSLENEKSALKIVENLKYNINTNINEVETIIPNVYSIILLLFIINSLYIWWNLNKKLNRKGYIALIPIYNILCLSKDILGSRKYCLLLLLPIANAIFMLLLIIKLGKKFNKSTNYILLMIFIPIIFIPSLAFEELSYQ